MLRIASSLVVFCLLVFCPLLVFPGCDVGKAKVPANTTDWVAHKDGNLSVKLPFKPKLQTQEVKHPLLGTIQIKMYTCEISRKAALLVSQVKYPVSPKLYNVAAGLKGAVQGMAKETEGKIESEKEIKMGSLPGKEVVVSTPKKFVAKARVFIDGNGPTLYQFQAIGERSFLDDKAVDDFFASIEITPIAAKDKSLKGNATKAKAPQQKAPQQKATQGPGGSKQESVDK